ncbi:MAG: extracellular solute-binding protein [Treponema sp.]|jgi:putative aldouronate transport system substrate-binding protein|nr:extracellular solute-binding protein [Treponema sp.]
MKKTFIFAIAVLLISSGCQRNERVLIETGHPAGWIDYPIETNVTVSWWVGMTDKVSSNFLNYGQIPFGKGLVERTGVNIEWIHPVITAQNEQFNLMVASGDLPDIFSRDMHRLYPGGPQKAFEDGIILRLNDIFERYAPNLMAYLKANPDIDRMVKTDTGDYFFFPFIRSGAYNDFPNIQGTRKPYIFIGPLIRQDWLDELGLNMPETIDEWHLTLTAFKNRKGSSAPFTYEYTNHAYTHFFPFALAYGAPRGFFVGEDGFVRYGPVEDGRLEFLRTFALWYREGLIDADLISMRRQQVDAKMITGTSGVSMGALGSRMGAWITAARITNPNYHLVGAPWPVLNKGDKPRMSAVELPFTGVGSVYISTNNKNPHVAARLLDWAYSKEGHMFWNFGIEGESYNMIDGYPTYSDWVMNNPDGWTVDQAIAAYAMSADNGPMVQDIRYTEQQHVYQEQRDAVQLWTIEGAENFLIPPITLTPQESREFAQIMSGIETYVDEMETKFILGTESLTGAAWASYANTIRRLGIGRALEIQDTAFARYNAR